MSDQIQTICSLTGCSENEANEALDRTQDVVEAVDLLLAKAKTTVMQKRSRGITREEEIIAPIRKIMKRFDEDRATSSGQHGYEGSVEKLLHHEEMVLQNNCDQECQLPVQESMVQIQEIVCQSQSECSFCSQSNGQTLPCFDQGCSQLNRLQDMELLNMDEQIIVEVPLHEMSLDPPKEVDSVDQYHNHQESSQNCL